MTGSGYPLLMSEGDFEALLMIPYRGSGGSREVYNVSGDETVVIKKVHLRFVGANIIEWLVWNAVKDNSQWNEVFGSCVSISESGRYMMMEKLEDIDKAEWVRTPTVPSCLTDVWGNNFGRTAAGVIKIRDYASAKFSDYFTADHGHRRAWQLPA